MILSMIIAYLTMAGLCFLAGCVLLPQYPHIKAPWWTINLVGDVFALAALTNLFLETV